MLINQLSAPKRNRLGMPNSIEDLTIRWQPKTTTMAG